MSLNNASVSVGDQFEAQGGAFRVTIAGTLAAAPPTYDKTSIGSTTVDGTATVEYTSLYQKGFGVLLEGGTTNTVTSPNDVSISWVTAGSTFATGQTAPDESNTATLLSEDSSNGLHRATASATPTAVGSIYTASIFLKAGTRTQATVNISWLSGGLSYVDLVTGTIISKGVAITSLHSEPYANGWYRFIVVFTANISYNLVDVLGYDGTGFSYLGNPANNFLLWGAQVEASPYATSFIVGNRQNELGNLKFPTTQGWKGKNAFPHAGGCLAVTYCPQYSSGDFAGWKAFLSMFNINKPLGVQASGVMRTNDGTNATNSSYMPIPSSNDAVQVALRWGVGADAAQPNASMLLISLRNATTGGGWVHGVAVPYAGAFNDAGFLQFLAYLGGNNSVFRNTAIFDRPLTNNELQGYVIK